MKQPRHLFLLLTLLFFLSASATPGLAETGDGDGGIFTVDKTTRCPVCGMFVHKYPDWQAQVRLGDGTVAAFDGVKDMLAYFFDPQAYGAAEGSQVVEVAVREYYNLGWTDGHSAWYVVGSTLLGPMGHELVPFADRAAAENFLRDHQGREILGFAEITLDLVQTLRHGSRMRPPPRQD